MSYQRMLKRSGSGSPMIIRVACVREEVEYAVEESRTPGEDRWNMMFIWLAMWRWENSSLPEIENTIFNQSY